MPVHFVFVYPAMSWSTVLHYIAIWDFCEKKKSVTKK